MDIHQNVRITSPALTIKLPAQRKSEPLQAAKPTLNSLHDVVVDYMSCRAYAGTVRALSRISVEHETTFAPTLSSSSNGVTGGDQNEGSGDAVADGMEVDSDNRARKTTMEDKILRSIERRRELLDFVLSGAINKAIEVLKTHFPAVLADQETNGSVTTSANNSIASGTITPKSRLPAASVLPPDSASLTHNVPVLCTSLVPAHIRLNLQIQQFIESFRQLNPSSNNSSPSSSISSLSTSQTLGGSSGTTLTHALTAAHGLHSEAKKLSPDERAIYLQEIKDVGALFAYENIEASPLKGFLDQGRRIRLAEQVNMAILNSEGKPPQSQLEEHSRRMVAIYKVLEANKIDTAPTWTSEDGPVKERIALYWKFRDIKNFDFHEFVTSEW
ncbi:uncharacterized protein L203_103579 [Cryptococcus depauperatus CBS 7841]|uniref:CTLH domain-containing protein n=1 Tax=Cryptococcus depauperatus CBS 7841 TaxID=1295531 RepID=A0AAJ8JTY4_9TREE